MSNNVIDSSVLSMDAKGRFILPPELSSVLLTSDKPGFWIIASGDQAYLMSHQHDRHVCKKVKDADAAQDRLKALKRSGFWLKPENDGGYLLPASLWDTFADKTFTVTSGKSDHGVFQLKKT